VVCRIEKSFDEEKLSISGLVPNGRVWIDTRNIQEGGVLLCRRRADVVVSRRGRDVEK
jgi:hypothetical protein